MLSGSLAEHHKMPRVMDRDVIGDGLRPQHSTAASHHERLLLNRFIWRRRRTLCRRLLADRLRGACDTTRSLVQEGKSAQFNWQRAFLHGSPAVLLRQLHAAQGNPKLEIPAADVVKCLGKLNKGKSSLDGVTAEMMMTTIPESTLKRLPRVWGECSLT